MESLRIEDAAPRKSEGTSIPATEGVSSSGYTLQSVCSSLVIRDGPKSLHVQEAASALAVPLDSVLFFDDRLRDVEVRNSLPCIAKDARAAAPASAWRIPLPRAQGLGSATRACMTSLLISL